MEADWVGIARAWLLDRRANCGSGCPAIGPRHRLFDDAVQEVAIAFWRHGQGPAGQRLAGEMVRRLLGDDGLTPKFRSRAERVHVFSLDDPCGGDVERDETGAAVVADADAADPVDSAAGSERASALADAVVRLPDRQRAVVSVRLAGGGWREAARAAGVGVSAAKTHYARAVESLRADAAAAGMGP